MGGDGGDFLVLLNTLPKSAIVISMSISETGGREGGLRLGLGCNLCGHYKASHFRRSM